MIPAEAQMHWVAVVASHTGGLAEIVRDGSTGHPVPPGDVEAPPCTLAKPLGSRDRAHAMGLRDHEHARARCSLDGFTDQFEAIYRDAIALQGGDR